MKHSGDSRMQKENDTKNRWYFYGYIERKWARGRNRTVNKQGGALNCMEKRHIILSS